MTRKIAETTRDDMSIQTNQGPLSDEEFSRLAKDFLRTTLAEGQRGGPAIEELLIYYAVPGTDAQRARQMATDVLTELWR